MEEDSQTVKMIAYTSIAISIFLIVVLFIVSAECSRLTGYVDAQRQFEPEARLQRQEKL